LEAFFDPFGLSEVAKKERHCRELFYFFVTKTTAPQVKCPERPSRISLERKSKAFVLELDEIVRPLKPFR
jgi:hypothetical protein